MTDNNERPKQKRGMASASPEVRARVSRLGGIGQARKAREAAEKARKYDELMAKQAHAQDTDTK